MCIISVIISIIVSICVPVIIISSSSSSNSSSSSSSNDYYYYYYFGTAWRRYKPGCIPTGGLHGCLVGNDVSYEELTRLARD